MRILNGKNKYKEIEVIDVHDIDDTYAEYLITCDNNCYECAEYCNGIECVKGELVYNWEELGCNNVDDCLEGIRVR